jgi:uncharacterized membrane protein
MSGRLASAWWSDARGAVAPVAAVAMIGLVGLGALVTDVGAWYARRGRLQSAADAAAMAAAGKAQPATVAGQVMGFNGFSAADLVSVEPGYYCPDVDRSVTARFSATACATGAVTPSSPNAVRVTARTTAPLLFSSAILSGSRGMKVQATAARIDEAGLVAGSGVAAVDPALANAALGAFLGGSGLNLTAVQYQALASVDIGAGEYLDALAARVGATGTYADLVALSVNQTDVLQAAIDVANAHGATVAGGALSQIKSKVTGNPTVALSKLFSLGVWSKLPINASENNGALKAGVDLHQLAVFSAQLAGPAHAVTIPAGSIGIPGVLSATIEATAVEPPVGSYFAFGPAGMSVHTAQVRTQLRLGIPALTGVSSLPIYFEGGQGDATLTSISCGDEPKTDATVRVQARSGVSALYIGSVAAGVMNNFSQPVTSANVQAAPIIELTIWPLPTTLISGRSQVTLGSGNWTQLTFVQPGQGGGDGTIGAPLSGAGAYSESGYARVVSTGMTSNLFGSLIGNLSISASVLGIGVSLPPGSLGTVTSILNPILGALDPVVDQLLAANGIGLGYLDVGATGVRCGAAVTIA